MTAAAIAWAHADLDGTPSEIEGLLGTECLSGASPSAEQADLTRMRAALEQQVGRPVNEIRITGVRTRNLTATSGEAEVEYDLPASVVGNDNWVTYQIESGHWKVADCKAPIGGDSQSSPEVTTPEVTAP